MSPTRSHRIRRTVTAAAVAAATLLAACSSGDDDTSDEPTGNATETDLSTVDVPETGGSRTSEQIAELDLTVSPADGFEISVTGTYGVPYGAEVPDSVDGVASVDETGIVVTPKILGATTDISEASCNGASAADAIPQGMMALDVQLLFTVPYNDGGTEPSTEPSDFGLHLDPGVLPSADDQDDGTGVGTWIDGAKGSGTIWSGCLLVDSAANGEIELPLSGDDLGWGMNIGVHGQVPLSQETVGGFQPITVEISG